MNKPTKSGAVVIISGPSGVGKGTVIAKLKELNSNLSVAVSATTRPPRAGEIDGVHYFFLDQLKFQALIDQNAFLEWCTVHGNRYGTLKTEVVKKVECGEDVILEIDTQGASKIKGQANDLLKPLFIFIDKTSHVALLKFMNFNLIEYLQNQMNYSYEICNQINS